MKVEHAGLEPEPEPEPIWDSDTAGGGLTYIVLAPINKSLNLKKGRKEGSRKDEKKK